MPVELDKMPLQLPEPSAPRLWLWLVFLAALLLLGLGLMLWRESGASTDQPQQPLWIALGLPTVIWAVLCFMRTLMYLGEWSLADGWNDAREADLCQKMSRGRRSQQVLAVSLHTALREPGAPSGDAQRDALHNATKAVRTQPAWLVSEEGIRHSRLMVEPGDTPNTLLRRVLRQVLGDMAKALIKLPKDTPLALLLEMHSSVPAEDFEKLWQETWSESGIVQTVHRIEGAGLATVDGWLDQRIHEQTLLLVVAFQVAPEETENTAEAVVGLLFGNRLTQTTLEPLAYLHRPEQVRSPTADGLLYATRQALDWVPITPASIRHVWLAGIDAKRASAITTTVSEVAMPVSASQGLRDLDSILGNPGCAAPWLAIAVAVDSIRDEAKPHFIFNGDSASEAGLWCSTVMPPVLNQEVS